jgi:hypothetical protein
MCRAVWVILVASGEAATRLRRAVGSEAQVVDVQTSAAGFDERTEADVVIVDASAGAEEVALVRARLPRAAVVWVGPDTPAAAHHGVPYDEVEEALPGALTKALIARNATGRDQ